jgi:hypothetical protein
MFTKVKKAQFYTMAVAVIAVALISTSIIIVGVRNSMRSMEVSEDIYFVLNNIRSETLRRVELILSNLTQMDKSGATFNYLEIAKSYLDEWIECLKNEYESRGYKLHLSYDPSQLSYLRNWNNTISTSIFTAIINIQLENENAKIEQTVNATHIFKLSISKVERIGSNLIVQVNFTKTIGTLEELSVDYAVVYINGTRANYVGGGMYQAELIFTGPDTVTVYVSAVSSSGIFVEALETR